MTQHIKSGSSLTISIPAGQENQRIDKFITQQFSQYSRSFLQKLFHNNQIFVLPSDTLPAKAVKPSYLLKKTDQIILNFPEEQTNQTPKSLPDDLIVNVLAQTSDFLIINKPAGLVVHAPNKNYQHATLTDWLIQSHKEIALVGLIDRPGIVHRLDKETSGLMIIAKTNHAHATLSNMFKQKKIKKTYLAIAMGHPMQQGSMDFLIGRHPVARNKMHHFTPVNKTSNSRQAHTDFQTLTYYKDFSLVKAMPTTGRTHQIRVHFAAIGHPILADSVYGKSSKILKRHALHAHQLEFEYEGTAYCFSSPLPEDLQNILNNATQIK